MEPQGVRARKRQSRAPQRELLRETRRQHERTVAIRASRGKDNALLTSGLLVGLDSGAFDRERHRFASRNARLPRLRQDHQRRVGVVLGRAEAVGEHAPARLGALRLAERSRVVARPHVGRVPGDLRRLDRVDASPGQRARRRSGAGRASQPCRGRPRALPSPPSGRRSAASVGALCACRTRGRRRAHVRPAPRLRAGSRAGAMPVIPTQTRDRSLLTAWLVPSAAEIDG
jgi:hypothetical protein